MKRYVRSDSILASGIDIVKVPLTKLYEILDSADHCPHYRPLGYFYSYNPNSNTWDAIDNSTGDAWTEAFSTEEDAIAWLKGEFEVGEES